MQGLVVVFGVIDEDDVAGFHPVDLIDAQYREIVRTAVGAAEDLSDLFERVWARKLQASVLRTLAVGLVFDIDNDLLSIFNEERYTNFCTRIDRGRL